jgi:hypothetical protein
MEFNKARELAMKESVFSNPRLISVLKKMAEVSRSRPQPYEITGDSRHMIISRRKPTVENGQTTLASNKK